MKRTEVTLIKSGKQVRGVLEQFEASDQTFITSGNANGTNSTVIFNNSSGGSFTVTNGALLFNDAYVSGGTLNSGVVTFTNTDGGTFQVSGFDGFNSYWSVNADGSISNIDDTKVGVGTQTPNEKLTVNGSISGNTHLYISGDATVGGSLTFGTIDGGTF